MLRVSEHAASSQSNIIFVETRHGGHLAFFEVYAYDWCSFVWLMVLAGTSMVVALCQHAGVV